jgi:ankyrin repeat protein
LQYNMHALATTEEVTLREIDNESSRCQEIFETFKNLIDDETVSLQQIEALLKKNQKYLATTYVYDDVEYTFLHYAAQEGDIKVVKFLVEQQHISADIKTENLQITPLMLAAREGMLAVVKYLSEQGADVNQCDLDQATALHYATGADKIEVVDFLLNHGADVSLVDKYGFNIVHIAASYDFVDLVKLVKRHTIEKGFKGIVNKKTQSNETPLIMAIVGDGGEDMVELLLKDSTDEFTRQDINAALNVAVGLGYLDLENILNKYLDLLGRYNNKDNYKQTNIVSDEKN